MRREPPARRSVGCRDAGVSHGARRRRPLVDVLQRQRLRPYRLRLCCRGAHGVTKPGFIPFNLPSMVGRELEYIVEAVRGGHLAGDGAFTRRCQQWLEERCGARKVLLTHSCTAALEMAALLCDAGEGDEVIMPSFTFVSTANAFALRGARPVFVDIRPDTLNMDEQLIEAAITERTRAIVAVHYAGIGCDMAAIAEIAERHGLPV